MDDTSFPVITAQVYLKNSTLPLTETETKKKPD